MQIREWQFDGIVGPTHNYAGLATGNLASAYNKGAVSNPRQAALQSLTKMRFVHNLGVPQAFLPPHYRPLISELRSHGFTGDLGTILDNAYRTAPALLASVFSSSFMWAANAATVTLSVDSVDKRLHFTPANLISHHHRRIESSFHYRNLKTIFHNEKLFFVDEPLEPVGHLSDEAAANHMVISLSHGFDATHVFAYGKSHEYSGSGIKYTPRQHREASERIAHNHGLRPENCLFLRQSGEAIDAGVFHNDVIAMNTTSRMILHEQSFIMEDQNRLRKFFAEHPEFRLREIRNSELTIQDAVSTYLFNSQLLELPSGRFALVAPSECSNHAAVAQVIASLLEEGMLDEVYYLDVRESMRNGGGPACLRLRVIMTPEQESAICPSVVLTSQTGNQLEAWINQYYRDRLSFDDLRDPFFVKELDDAYGAFETRMNLQGLYEGYRIDS